MTTPAASPPLADQTWWRWAAVVGVALAVILAGAPEGITPEGWRLFAIFLATIVGSILRPAPPSAVVLFGVCAMAVTKTMTPALALKGYSDPVVWLVLCAFFISRGVMKTGLGRRIAFLFIRALGRKSLGLGYALVGTDALLATIVPSNSARAGGIVFPIVRSLSEAYDSTPGATRRRLGAYLMKTVYQCDVIACAMFLTGQASNVIIAKFAMDAAGIELTYAKWMLGGIVPGLVALLLVPWVLFRLFPPEVKETPHATAFAREELRKIGPMIRGEKLMLAVFAFVAILWMTPSIHGIHYAVVALLGVCTLLLTGVIEWSDLLAERQAWDTFIWYGGLVRMAEALGDTGVTKRFAEVAGGWTAGWDWTAALLILVVIYFYAHYAFASITAHATAMFTPFLVVAIAAGAPPQLAVLSLAAASNLDASLTHYGTTHAPIYFGAQYVTQREWWRLGFIVSLVTLGTWGTVGVAWWKLLGWW
ncbi:MAG: DASS family sodium-coupled anion symporter [Gemmatimonadetes bacterium]|nr:DASS family sodium-coupled anion symporter [Gemmatimonadota bacterium]